VALSGIDYVGGDIVPELIEANNRQYGRAGIRFRKVDLLSDQLPASDLILCRDCLVHLSFSDVTRALRNICRSEARYLLTTTFIHRQQNADILTGDWRTLNLQIAPFNLPAPVELINERCTEGNGAYCDKALGLWKIEDIRQRVDQLRT
jgi:hypothetical protein